MLSIIKDSIRGKINLWSAVYSIFVSLNILLLLHPLDSNAVEVTVFSRKIGKGIINDYNADSVLKNFMIWFVIFSVCVCLFYIVINTINNITRCSRRTKYVMYLKPLLLIADIYLCFYCMVFYNIYSGDYSKLNHVTMNFMALLIAFVSLMILYVALNGEISEKIRETFCRALIIFSAVPILSSVFIETVYVLNQYNIFIKEPMYALIGFIGIYIAVMCAVMFFFLRKSEITKCWRKTVYPLFILGTGFLSVQLPLTQVGKYDIMESSNYSVLISNALNFGMIPTIQEYGGHQLQSVIGGLIYGILNNDFKGAAFAPYAVYITPVLALLFYEIIKRITGEDMAFWISLFIPYYGEWFYYGMGALTCIAAIKFLNKKTYLSAALLWAVCVMCVLYRLDMGFAFGIAVSGTLLLYCIINKDVTAFKRLGITFLISAVIAAALWFVLCIFKNVDPIMRLREYLALSASNQVWSYENIGDSTTVIFAFTYVLIPLSCICIVIFLILNKRFYNQNGISLWAITLIFGMAYIANFQRALTRHSLAEMNTSVCFFTALFFLSIFITIQFNKKWIFPIAFSGFIILDTLLTGTSVFSQKCLMDNAVNKVNEIVSEWKTSDFEKKACRITWSKELSDEAVPLQDICNTVLSDNETFADFINEDFLYSVIGRRFPVYMSQSPLMVSGEFTQEMFIDEISEDCPLVLMPTDESGYRELAMDDIANPVRYYKLAEYIYRNYRPLVKTGDNALWCRNERYREFSTKLSDKYEKIDYGYDISGNPENIKYVHNYELQKLPYLWGNKDEKKAWDNKRLCDVSLGDNGIYQFDVLDASQKEKGNYLMFECTNDADATENNGFIKINLSVGCMKQSEFEEKYRYSFDIPAGESRELIRISADYCWYAYECNAIMIDSGNENIGAVKMAVLDGD